MKHCRLARLVPLVVVSALVLAVGSLTTSRAAQADTAAVYLDDADANLAAATAADHLVESLTLTDGVSFDNTFAGTEITNDGLLLRLAPGASDALSAAIPSSEDGVPVIKVPAAASDAALTAVMQAVDADKQYWQSRGIDITVMIPNTVAGNVTAYLAHYTTSAEAALRSRYQNMLVVSNVDTPRVGLWDSRANDSTPVLRW